MGRPKKLDVRMFIGFRMSTKEVQQLKQKYGLKDMSQFTRFIEKSMQEKLRG